MYLGLTNVLSGDLVSSRSLLSLQQLLRSLELASQHRRRRNLLLLRGVVELLQTDGFVVRHLCVMK